MTLPGSPEAAASVAVNTAKIVVGRHVRAHGCGLRACEAYGRAVVEEVRGATEGERIVSGLFQEEFEEIDRLTV